MTTRKLLENLEKRLEEITAAISLIKQIDTEDSRVYKRTAIINHVKGLRGPYKKKNWRDRKYKPGTHWMQKPENKARVIAMAKKRAALRKQKEKK